MNDHEIIEHQEKTKMDPQTDLLHSELEQTETGKITLRSILKFFYSANGKVVTSFGLGVLAGVLVISIVFKFTLEDTGSVSGTVGGIDNYENFESADYLQINTQTANGHIAVQYQGEMVIAQVNLNSKENVKMMLSFNPDNMKVYSVKTLQLNDESSINSGKSFVTLNNKGESRYLILFRDSMYRGVIQVKVITESGQVDNFSVKTRVN